MVFGHPKQSVTKRSKRRLVVKVGTNTLTNGADSLCRPVMLNIVRQVAQLLERGDQVALVTSGAIVAGREALGMARDAKDIPLKQVLAAVGQARLMQTWDQLFSHYGLIVAQTLLTRADLADRQRYLNARSTLLTLLDRGVVPVVNENDVVAVEEIKIGDNDNLSALVANLVDADLLVLLTDTAGLYTADPRRDSSATLVTEVPKISDAILRLAEGAGTARGTGGMATKIQAARLATESGIAVLIADGRADNVIVRASEGESIGTRFPPVRSGVESRKRWILAGLAGTAAARIDEGAAEALTRGRSLLPAGVVDLTGRFDRGDSVSIVGPSGKAVACGVVNYSAADLARIKGCRSSQIAAVLGYHYGDEAIHRSNLVML
jgi:glutamate 5-kinase